MKDYSLTFEESKIFIMNYKIKDDKIIVKFGNGKKTNIDYIKENEEKILEKMWKQTVNRNIVKDKAKELYSKHLKKSIWFGILALVFGALITVSEFPSIIFMIAGFSVFGSIATYNIINVIKLAIIKKDLKKTELFTSINYELNNELNRSSALNNVSKKTKNIIEKNNNRITINSIDKMSLKDLKRIKDNIDFENEIGINNPKAKKLVK